MDIKGEASVFKVDVAKGLKQLSENVDVNVVVGKKVENKTTEIKIEDKSKHSTINFNFILAGSVSEEQIVSITKRIKSIIDIQADVAEASGDNAFESYISQGIKFDPVVAGTANALIIQNAQHIFQGAPKPVFIKYPASLPMSVNVTHIGTPVL